jgi:DNA damage-inducible protein 1
MCKNYNTKYLYTNQIMDADNNNADTNTVNAIDFSDIINATQKENAIEENLQKAVDEIPESLTSVNMLYIPATINGVELKLFVDTGAQISIIPLETAFNLGMEELIDYKYQGTVKGVGEQEILGKIHFVELQLSDFLLGCSFTVISEQEDIIFGLDMLLAHGMKIDLEKKCLVLANIEIQFCDK